jgi:hypothetical protein
MQKHGPFAASFSCHSCGVVEGFAKLPTGWKRIRSSLRLSHEDGAVLCGRPVEVACEAFSMTMMAFSMQPVVIGQKVARF